MESNVTRLIEAVDALVNSNGNSNISLYTMLVVVSLLFIEKTFQYYKRYMLAPPSPQPSASSSLQPTPTINNINNATVTSDVITTGQ